ncbi:MAG: hypothetical protein IJU79_02150 [Desulfovibrionaceae bacterium]|nr:hypothetical protein [Desulfovibrionaceae bacterium]
MLRCPKCKSTKKFRCYEAHSSSTYYELDAYGMPSEARVVSSVTTHNYECAECGTSGERWLFEKNLRCPKCDNRYFIARNKNGVELRLSEVELTEDWKIARLQDFHPVTLECRRPTCKYKGDVEEFIQGGELDVLD